MKIFTLTSQTFDAEEKWYDPMNGYVRIDEYHYLQPNRYQKESITTKKNITTPKEKSDKTLFETVMA